MPATANAPAFVWLATYASSFTTMLNAHSRRRKPEKSHGGGADGSGDGGGDGGGGDGGGCNGGGEGGGGAGGGDGGGGVGGGDGGGGGGGGKDGGGGGAGGVKVETRPQSTHWPAALEKAVLSCCGVTFALALA